MIWSILHEHIFFVLSVTWSSESHITSVKAKKIFRLNVLKESPETVIADFTVKENSKDKAFVTNQMHGT